MRQKWLLVTGGILLMILLGLGYYFFSYLKPKAPNLVQQNNKTQTLSPAELKKQEFLAGINKTGNQTGLENQTDLETLANIPQNTTLSTTENNKTSNQSLAVNNTLTSNLASQKETNASYQKQLPANSVFSLNFFDLASDFLLKNYDFKQNRFVFSLKKANLYFGLNLPGIAKDKLNTGDLSLQRQLVLKYVLNSSFGQRILPIANYWLKQDLEHKLDELATKGQINQEQKQLFYQKLAQSLKRYAQLITTYLNAEEYLNSLFNDYFLAQQNLMQIYQQYWQLEDSQSRERDQLARLIKKNIFVREKVKQKILARFAAVQGVSLEDKFYLSLWVYRRLARNGFKPNDVFVLVDCLQKTAEFFLK